MTSKALVGEWFDRGVSEAATHMIVVCDTFDNEDYPVLVKAGENAREIASMYDEQNLQRVVEVYDLALDKASQIEAPRVFNY